MVGKEKMLDFKAGLNTVKAPERPRQELNTDKSLCSQTQNTDIYLLK